MMQIFLIGRFESYFILCRCARLDSVEQGILDIVFLMMSLQKSDFPLLGSTFNFWYLSSVRVIFSFNASIYTVKKMTKTFYWVEYFVLTTIVTYTFYILLLWCFLSPTFPLSHNTSIVNTRHHDCIKVHLILSYF